MRDLKTYIRGIRVVRLNLIFQNSLHSDFSYKRHQVKSEYDNTTATTIVSSEEITEQEKIPVGLPYRPR